MTRHQVDFTGVRETMLLTLMGKARESRQSNSLLKDSYAAAAMEAIAYDFSRLRPRRAADTILALRAHIFDEITRAFIAAHPECTVIHMACGLDTRVFRVDPPADVRWYDIDFPDTIALRSQLYPARPGYTLIGTSLTAPGWLDTIPADRPTLIMAEGLTPYLLPKEGLALFAALCARFPQAEIAVDIFSRLGCRLAMLEGTISATGATLSWGIDHPDELTTAIPGLRFLEERAAYHPEMRRLGWPTAAFFWLILKLAVVRNFGRIVRFDRR